MQSIIVLALFIVAGLFTIMENRRNSPVAEHKYSQFKSSAVAGNIEQYNDLLTQYLTINYESYHLVTPNNQGNVEQIELLNYQQDQIATYSQKNLTLFLNYTSVAFNYSLSSIESLPIPTLYLASSWDNYAAGIAGYKITSMPEVMGATNQLFSKHVYQGNSVYWTIPWLLKQSNCNVVELYGQIPNDSTGAAQFSKVRALFNQFCSQIQANSQYRFLTYVYVAPIYLPEV